MILFKKPEDMGTGLIRYELEMDHPYTIDEFLTDIRERNEFGEIIVNTGLGRNIRASYMAPSNEKIFGKQLRIVNIRSAIAYGGFGMMDYMVCI